MPPMLPFPRSTTVVSAAHTVTPALAGVAPRPGPASSSSTVTVASWVSVTPRRCPNPFWSATVTMLSSSLVVSSTVRTRSCISCSPTANVALAGSEASSMAPFSPTDNGTLSVSDTSPVRVRVNSASEPSCAYRPALRTTGTPFLHGLLDVTGSTRQH